MNQFEVKEMYIKFLIHNSRVQNNNFKMNFKLKVEKDLIFCEINGIAPCFSLVLSEVYSEPSHTSKIKHFAETVNNC